MASYSNSVMSNYTHWTQSQYCNNNNTGSGYQDADIRQVKLKHSARRTYNSALSKTSYNGGLWENIF